MEPIRKVKEEADLVDSIEEGDVEDLVEERNLVVNFMAVSSVGSS